MERQLSYALKLSLKEISLRKVAVLLWLQPGVFDEILQFRLKQNIYNRHEWRAISWKVEDSISKLPLPGSIQKQLIPKLKDVGLGILKWILFHEEYFNNRNDFFRELHQKVCFTAAGAVDDRKTAEKLVDCDALDVVGRFRLACIYCLESRIPPLWSELPPLYKVTISSQDEAPHLHLILPSMLEQEKSRLILLESDFNPRNDFECAALLGHKTSSEYCFQKLQEEERRSSLIRTAKGVIKYRSYELILRFGRCVNLYTFLKEKNSDVACYLLSLMTPEEQTLIFQELPCEVLRCFLEWPWRDLFGDIADVVWPFLPESKYDHLVLAIKTCLDGYYYFPKFYQNLFLRCPITFRKFVAKNGFDFPSLLEDAVLKDDTETIRLIFRDVEAADRVRVLSSPNCFKIIYRFPHKWPLLEEFLQDAAPSRGDKRRLKKAFTEHLVRYGEMEGAKDRCRSFFEYVDDVDESASSKRRRVDLS